MRKQVAAADSAVFFLAGPGVVAGLVPWLLTGWRWHEPAPHWMIARIPGVLLIAAGLVVLVHAFVRFVAEGLGTPVPAAAPTRLVVGGLYRWVRNPVYVALLAIVLGQALLLGQLGPLIYAAVVWAIAASCVRWRKEPVLARRFGADYDRYRRAVSAWLPRVRPWRRDRPGQRDALSSTRRRDRDRTVETRAEPPPRGRRADPPSPGRDVLARCCSAAGNSPPA